MGTGLEWVAVGAMVAGAAASAYSANEQRQAAKEQSREIRKAQEAERDIGVAKTNEEAARDRRTQIREARIKRAMVANTAAVTGQSQGSAATVGGQAVTGQAGANIGSINTASSWAGIQGAAAQNTANAQGAVPNMSLGGQIAGSVGPSLMNIGVNQTAKSIFKE